MNTIRIRLGHESLDVTLALLKGKDAESEVPKCLGDDARSTWILWPFALAQLADPDNQRKSHAIMAAIFWAHLVH